MLDANQLAVRAARVADLIVEICRHNDLDPRKPGDRQMIRFFLNERGWTGAMLDDVWSDAMDRAQTKAQLAGILGTLGDALATAIIFGGGLLAYSLLTMGEAHAAEASRYVATADGLFATAAISVGMGFVLGFTCAAVTGFLRPPVTACGRRECPPMTDHTTPNFWNGL